MQATTNNKETAFGGDRHGPSSKGSAGRPESSIGRSSSLRNARRLAEKPADDAGRIIRMPCSRGQTGLRFVRRRRLDAGGDKGFVETAFGSDRHAPNSKGSSGRPKPLIGRSTNPRSADRLTEKPATTTPSATFRYRDPGGRQAFVSSEGLGLMRAATTNKETAFGGDRCGPNSKGSSGRSKPLISQSTNPRSADRLAEKPAATTPSATFRYRDPGGRQAFVSSEGLGSVRAATKAL